MRKRVVYLSYLVSALAVLVLAACTAMQAAAPTTLKQQIAVAYSTVAGLERATSNALTVGTIKVEDAKQVRDIASGVYASLDAASALQSQGNDSAAGLKLDTANAALLQLQQFLHSKGVSNGS